MPPVADPWFPRGEASTLQVGVRGISRASTHDNFVKNFQKLHESEKVNLDADWYNMIMFDFVDEDDNDHYDDAGYNVVRTGW